MGRFRPLSVLLLSALLLSTSLPQGYGREMKVVRHYDGVPSFHHPSLEKITGGREMKEMVMDYRDPVANTNPKGGVSPPSPSSP